MTSTSIGLIPLFDAPGLFLDLGHSRLVSVILEKPAPGPLFETGDEENFQVCIWENHGAHISAVGHQISVGAHAALHPE